MQSQEILEILNQYGHRHSQGWECYQPSKIPVKIIKKFKIDFTPSECVYVTGKHLIFELEAEAIAIHYLAIANEVRINKLKQKLIKAKVKRNKNKTTPNATRRSN